jgi:hypothetical protein
VSGRADHLDTWRRSAQFRAIALAACRKMNAEHANRPKCGAKKRDGDPCRGNAMANGRCYRHGGKTGSDKPGSSGWHRTIWPKAIGPNAERKLARKVRDRTRKLKQQVARVAAMTAEERARYDEWKRTHRPGTPSSRARTRQDRDQAAAVRELMARPPRPPSAEAVELQARLDELRKGIAHHSTPAEDDPGQPYQGAFS